MGYLPIITAIVSGLLVWALGRWNTNKDERKREKKPLNRLLYNSPKTEIDEAGLEKYCQEMIPRLIASAVSFAEHQQAHNPLSLPNE